MSKLADLLTLSWHYAVGFYQSFRDSRSRPQNDFKWGNTIGGARLDGINLSNPELNMTSSESSLKVDLQVYN
jgi:hypothetical protein